MDVSLPSPTSQTGLVAYYTFDNLINKQGNSAFNGVLGGGASINKTNPECTFIADSCGSKTIACNYDFAYKQDVCNPLSVQFFSLGDTTSNSYWSFGDGAYCNREFTTYTCLQCCRQLHRKIYHPQWSLP